MPKPELQLYENDTDTVIAHSPEDAVAVWDEHIGDSYVGDGYGGVEDWTVRQADTKLRVDSDGTVETRSNDEWIAKEGRGFLCSTEF